jgi:hypothetical protein
LRTCEFRKNTDFCVSVSVLQPNICESTGFEWMQRVKFL